MQPRQDDVQSPAAVSGGHRASPAGFGPNQRQMNKAALLTLLLVMNAASADVVPIGTNAVGENTYMVADSGPVLAYTIYSIYKQATDFCARQQKQVATVELKQDPRRRPARARTLHRRTCEGQLLSWLPDPVQPLLRPPVGTKVALGTGAGTGIWRVVSLGSAQQGSPGSGRTAGRHGAREHVPLASFPLDFSCESKAYRAADRRDIPRSERSEQARKRALTACSATPAIRRRG